VTPAFEHLFYCGSTRRRTEEGLITGRRTSLTDGQIM
jgi:hypothetical protein